MENLKLTNIEQALVDDRRIYFFGWTLGNGHVRFGFHGTRLQWLAKYQEMSATGSVHLHTCRLTERVGVWPVEVEVNPAAGR